MTPAEQTFLRSYIEKSMSGAGQYYTPARPSDIAPNGPFDFSKEPQVASSTVGFINGDRELNRIFRAASRREESENIQQQREFKQIMDDLHRQRRYAAQQRLNALRKRLADEKSAADQQRFADAMAEKQIQFDWVDAAQEDQFQSTWKDAIAEDATRDQFNPIKNFAASPASHLISQLLPYGMRDNARRALGMASQAYGAMPFSRRRQIHAFGARAANIFGRFAPQQFAPAIGNLGSQFGFSQEASMGIAGGAVAAGALMIGGKNISSMAQSGHHIVDSLVGGIKSSMGDVTAAGKQIVSVLAGAALSPFGKSGQAVGGLGGAVLGSAANLGGAAIGGITGIAGSLGGAVGGVAGVGLGAVGAIGGAMVGGPLGAAIGGVVMTTLGMLVGKVLSAVSSIFGGILKAAGAMAGELGKVIASGISAAIDVVKDTLQTLMSFAQNMQSIWMNSGLSTRTAAGALMNSQALGMSAQDASSMFSGNVLFQRGRQAMIGARGEPGSSEFFTSAQARYQRLLAMAHGNPMIANQVFQSAGYGAMIPAMNVSPGLTNYAMQTSSRMQSAFGLDPEKIKQAGQQMAVLNGLFGQFVDLVKMKFAQELFPFLSNIFGRLIDYVSGHSGQIADFIKKSVVFLVEKVPVLIATGVAGIAHGLGLLSEAIGIGAKWLSDHLPYIVQFFDAIINKIGALLGLGNVITEATGGKSGMPRIPGMPGQRGSNTPLLFVQNSMLPGLPGEFSTRLPHFGLTSAPGRQIPAAAGTHTVHQDAPAYIRIPFAAVTGLLGAAAIGGGTLGAGAVAGGVGGYAFGSYAANKLFGHDVQVPNSPGVTKVQDVLSRISGAFGTNENEGYAKQFFDFEKEAKEFGKNWQSQLQQILSESNQTNKDLAEVLKKGIDVHVSTEYKLYPTDKFLAEATAKASWAKWRKMSQAVG